MKRLVNIEIDNISVQVEEGCTIMNAAKQIGIELPTLCHMKDQMPDGSCRMCVVEVEGRRGLQIGCATECYEGMKVFTKSSKVIDARRFILELLLSKHETKCFNCAQNGMCKLQEYCMEYEVEDSRFENKETHLPIDTSNPYFDFDPNLCINCHTCSRICGDIMGRKVISNNGRGFTASMGPAYYRHWNTTRCESCGNCVFNCPTGALSTKAGKKYREWALKKVLTTCPECSLGCNINVLVKNNNIVGVEPATAFSENGMLCKKGRFEYEKLLGKDRLTYPMIRRNNRLLRTTWSDAVEYVAKKLKQLKKKYNTDSFAGLCGGKNTNEEYRLFVQLIRDCIGSSNLDVCDSKAIDVYTDSKGYNADIDMIACSDVIIVFGTDLSVSNPIADVKLRQASMRGSKIIVINPERTDICDYSHMHLQIKPGSYALLFKAMTGIVSLDNMGGIDAKDASIICNVKSEDIITAATLFKEAGTKGMIGYACEKETIASITDFAKACKMDEIPGYGINILRDSCNIQGACDNVLAIERGMGIKELETEGSESNIKVLYILGANPLETCDNRENVQAALKECDLVILQDSFMSATAKYADVILPGVPYSQKNGTFTNTQGVECVLNKALMPDPEGRSDSEILVEIMEKLGHRV